MNDYFDRLELELRAAAESGRHRPWHARLRLPPLLRGRGLVVAVVGLVAVAAPAVGAVSGWFSTGHPDKFSAPSATRGVGAVVPGGHRLLAIRAADPDGGPPWGMRLVRTTRGDSCLQIGRVHDGQIGSLGIDNAFQNDHEFHAIKADDAAADICGATDAAGHAFVNTYEHDTPASVDVPLGNVTETASPQQGMRMIFAGVLGPDARSITYRTPSGRTLTQATTGPEGAYLIVFRQTFENCFDFETRLPGQICGGSGYGGFDVRAPTAITRIGYADGKTCDVPSVASGRVCEPVGWVAPKLKKLTDGQVASPVAVHVSYEAGMQPPTVLIRVSFKAREPVDSSESLYQMTVAVHGHGDVTGDEITDTDSDIRRGQQVTLSVTQQLPTSGPSSEVWPGRYHGRVAFFPDIRRKGSPANGGLTVGRFSFTLPLPKRK